MMLKTKKMLVLAVLLIAAMATQRSLAAEPATEKGVQSGSKLVYRPAMSSRWQEELLSATPRLVRLCDHRQNLVTRIDQRVEHRHSKVRGAHEDNSHGATAPTGASSAWPDTGCA